MDVPGIAGVETPGGQAAESLGRRRFLRMLLAFSGISTLGMIVAPIVGFLIPPKGQAAAAGGRVLAGALTDFPAGTGKVVALGGKPAIVASTETGVNAFSAVCTHLGCIVGYDETVREIVCPCHDGHFNPSNGAVISGPPPRPLAPIATVVEDGKVFLQAAG